MLAFLYWQMGQRGFWGASLEVDPDSLVTPWLIRCWLIMVVWGLQRAHANLSRMYDLSDVRTFGICGTWKTAASYFLALGFNLRTRPPEGRSFDWRPFLNRYTDMTRQFLFGTPSQYRVVG